MLANIPIQLRVSSELQQTSKITPSEFVPADISRVKSTLQRHRPINVMHHQRWPHRPDKCILAMSAQPSCCHIRPPVKIPIVGAIAAPGKRDARPTLYLIESLGATLTRKSPPSSHQLQPILA